MGSVGEQYSVPKETQKIFEREVLDNPLLPTLPKEIKDAAKHIHFTGNDSPSIPINWRFAESAAALKGFEAAMLNVLRQKKYGSQMSDVSVNTDHASLFFMSPFVSKWIKPNGEKIEFGFANLKALEEAGFKKQDLHRPGVSWHRRLATNIYETKDERFYHVHGSMNPDHSLTALDLPVDGNDNDTYEAVIERIQGAVKKHDAASLDDLMNEKYKQAGTICWSIDEFSNSEHGKANAHVGLYDFHKVEGSQQPASWWPEQPSMPSSAHRPLAGLKVVDLTRVIAAPTITRSLAEMGASVMRVTSSSVTDLWQVHPDLNWGKWNCFLDLKQNPEDRKALAELIKDADVVVEGYRPGAMARNGFGREDILALVKDRDRGIIHVRENCYGWNGPWQHRSGWQQISDACCGVSLEFGKAMGLNEAVTPVFPNSDYCTGIAGSIGILHALISRAEYGGSYAVDSALNYYSQWLVHSVGTYPDNVWQDLWKRHGSPVYRHYHAMGHTVPSMMSLLQKYDEDVLFKPEFFERRTSKAMGLNFIQVKPIAQWQDEAVDLSFNVGCRSNGIDQPRWPKDLKVEVVD